MKIRARGLVGMNLGEVPQGRGEGGYLTSLVEASGGSHMPGESPLDAQQP